MPFFSLDRDIVFTPEDRPIYLVGDFPDFYALLHTSRTSSRADLENAILEAGSQLLAAALARGKSERILLLEQYMPVLRLALLDGPTRAAYNALLHHHQSGEAGAEATQDETEAFFAALRDRENQTENRDWTLAVRPLARWWRRRQPEQNEARFGSETA